MARFSISSLFGKSKGRIFDPTRDSAKDALKLLNLLTEELKQILTVSAEIAKTTPLKGFKNAQKVQTAIQKATTASKQLNVIEKERIKLLGKLKIANSDRIQKNVELKVQLREQNKINKKLAEDTLGLTDAYQEQSDKLNRLRKEYKSVAVAEGRTSKKARELRREVIRLDKELKKVDASSGQFGRSVAKYPKIFSRATAAMGLGVISMATFIQEVIRGIPVLGEFSDAISDVQKTTGLTEEEVRGLAETFKSFNTGTSVKDLLGIAQAAGRLGIAKDDIASFTEVVDKVFVSLGDELAGSADEIATNLAKIADVFGITERFGAAEGINKLGSAINELGAKTKAQSGFIADFTKRLVGVREITNISATDILGLGATLDELGQSVEVSGTAVSQILLKIGSNSSKFAKAAGLDVKEFKDLVNKDINEALIKFAEGISKGNKSTTALSTALAGLGIKGARSSAVVGALAGNTDKLRKNQELANKAFKEGTSLTDEFNIKNNNLAANLAKLEKSFSNFLLQGGFIDFLSGASEGLTKLINIIGGFDLESANEQTFEAALAAQKLANESEILLNRYEELTKDGVKPNEKSLIELNSITLTLKKSLGENVVQLNKETGAFELNTEAVRDQIKIKRFAADQEAATIASRLKGAQEDIKSSELVLTALNKQFDLLSKQQAELGSRAGNASVEGIQVMAKLRDVQKEQALETAKFNDLLDKKEDLTEELNKLGFKAADIELLFATKVKETTESLEDKDDALINLETRLEENLRLTSELNDELINQALAGDLNNETLKKYLDLTKELTDAQTKLKEAIEDTNLVLGIISPAKAFEGAMDDINKKQIEIIGTISTGVTAEEQKALDEKNKQRLESTKETLKALNALFQANSDKRLEQLDKEREATIRRQNQLLEKANSGVLDAQESLTEERAKQLRIEEAQRKQKEKAELTSAAFQMISAFIEAGNSPTSSLAQTGALLKTVPILIDAVTPGFVEGTGSGTVASELGAPQRQGVDGYDIRVHGPEKIFKEDHANMIPDGMSNFEVATLAQEYGRGSTSTPPDDTRLLNEVKELNKTMRNKAELVDIIPDMVNGVLKTVTRRAGNIDTTNRKGGWVA